MTPRLEDVEAAAQQRVLAYDRAGDGHYDTVSAFIKSLRGNDPDAALYWLAAMIAAGEDPRFIVRRLIISASEDVGNADPRALQVAVAAAQALDHIGLPRRSTRWPRQPSSSPIAEDRLRRPRVLRSSRRRHPARIAAGAQPPAHRRGPADEAARDRRWLPVPARLRGRRRPAAVPARRPGRPPLLRPDDQGHEVAIAARMADARSGQDRQAAAQEAVRPADGLDERRVSGRAKANRKKLAETQKRDASG